MAINFPGEEGRLAWNSGQRLKRFSKIDEWHSYVSARDVVLLNICIPKGSVCFWKMGTRCWHRSIK